MNVVIEKTIYERASAIFEEAAERHSLIWHRIAPLDEAKALSLQREKNAAAFIIGAKPYSEDFYRSLKKGCLVQRFGVGYGSVPVDRCAENGILVGYTPGALETAVAEHTMGLILALARHLPAMDAEMKEGRWNKIAGVELRGKTLCLIGFGKIAREVAFMARNGFRMRIVANGLRSGLDAEGKTLCDMYSAELGPCLEAADYVSLHVPDTPRTRGMVNRAFLAKMKTAACLVNTARGSLVDEEALADALETGRIGGAALDVFDPEPYAPKGKDLRKAPRCILTPHCASNTAEANARMARLCVENCLKLRAGALRELVLIPGRICGLLHRSARRPCVGGGKR